MMKLKKKIDDDFKIKVDNDFNQIKMHSYNDPYDDMLEQVISSEGLESVIKKLKMLKAPGWDKVQNEHIKYGGQSIVQMLLLYNGILIQEYTPLS